MSPGALPRPPWFQRKRLSAGLAPNTLSSHDAPRAVQDNPSASSRYQTCSHTARPQSLKFEARPTRGPGEGNENILTMYLRRITVHGEHSFTNQGLLSRPPSSPMQHSAVS